MNKLIAELRRLYFLPEQLASSLAGEVMQALKLVGPDGMTRAVVIGFKRAADWSQAAALFHAVQEDLDLPAPAVSIAGGGEGGYQLWFSLAEPVPVAEAFGFLNALRSRYLNEMPHGSVELYPEVGESSSAESGALTLVPALHATSGKWSAFIDPSMGSMFVDEPGLEMAPNMDRQADLLAGIKSILADDFQRALRHLKAEENPEAVRTVDGGAAVNMGARQRSKLNVGSSFSDPKSFLLAVMNDSSASAGQRIKAAKALLPFFDTGARHGK